MENNFVSVFKIQKKAKDTKESKEKLRTGTAIPHWIDCDNRFDWK
jgi:hypothetical protein